MTVPELMKLLDKAEMEIEKRNCRIHQLEESIKQLGGEVPKDEFDDSKPMTRKKPSGP
jgi:hypothetical protein